jgi:hypothetical protein
VVGVVKRQYSYFGPFPPKIAEIVDEETIDSIEMIMQLIPREKMTPFVWTTEREVKKRDNIFISNMMKFDWRDRPTAKELLEDKWWNDDVE